MADMGKMLAELEEQINQANTRANGDTWANPWPEFVKSHTKVKNDAK